MSSFDRLFARPSYVVWIVQQLWNCCPCQKQQSLTKCMCCLPTQTLDYNCSLLDETIGKAALRAEDVLRVLAVSHFGRGRGRCRCAKCLQEMCSLMLQFCCRTCNDSKNLEQDRLIAVLASASIEQVRWGGLQQCTLPAGQPQYRLPQYQGYDNGMQRVHLLLGLCLQGRIAAADRQAKPNLLGLIGRQLSNPHKQMFKVRIPVMVLKSLVTLPGHWVTSCTGQ